MPTKRLPTQKVTFSILAPEAQTVLLAGDFSNWDQAPIQLKRLKSGEWKGTVSLPQGQHQYRFLIDGQWRDDPSCSQKVLNSHGSENCVRVVP